MAAPKTIRLFEEIAVFCDIIQDNSKIYKLHQCIDPYSAPIKRHRIIRQAISRLHALNHSIDLASLACYLADHDLLDEVGGCRYLQYVADFHTETGETKALVSWELNHSSSGQ